VVSAYGPTPSDLDGDGDIDLVVPSFIASAGAVSVLLNAGDGTFAAPQSFAVGGGNPNNPIAVDLDNDLWPDIVIVNRNGNNVSVLINLTEYPPGLGDVNCDGTVDFGDINPFVLALSDPAQYEVNYPGCPLENRDINGDGACDFGDINPFVAVLTGG
jgi:hypothetical protein